MFELVKELTELPGPTGHEDAVQDWVERRWSDFAQDVRRTRVNNILARVGGTGPPSPPSGPRRRNLSHGEKCFRRRLFAPLAVLQ